MSLPTRRIFNLVTLRVNLRCNYGLKFMGTDAIRIVNENVDVHESLALPDMCLQVLGNGALGVSKSVLIRFPHTSALFNCGESADNSFKGNVNDVYVTHINWTNLGGLLSLVYKSVTSRRENINLCGPPGVDYFMRAAERFLRVHNNNSFKINLLDPSSMKKNVGYNYEIICIPLRSKNKQKFRPPAIKKSWLKSNFLFKNLSDTLLDRKPTGKIDLNTSYSYICRTESGKAWLLSACVKRGVQPGVHMQKLWNGESVTLDDGTTVQPDDVIKYLVPSNIIVIDCPTDGYLDDLLNNKKYDMYTKSENEFKCIIVHFTPISVMHNKRYIEWMNRFPLETKHLIVNDSNEWNGSAKVQNRQEVCRLISPRFFPKLRKVNDSNALTTQIMLHENAAVYGVDTKRTCSKETPTTEWLQKWSDQVKAFKLIQSWSGTCINLRDPAVERYFEPLVLSNPPNSEPNSPTRSPEYCPKNPRITFLGTSSQGSSTYRNTAGILIQMSDDTAMLLDCGDGTLKQLASLFDKVKLVEVLASLKCIYISHTHADHHAGVIGVLLAIKKARKLLRKQPHEVFVLIPPPLINWYEEYHNNIESVLEHVALINLSNLGKTMREQSYLNSMFQKTIGIKQIKVCWAIHSAFAYCVTLEHESGWKISYSGDTEYSDSFAKMGLGSDLLIHEATYGSGLNHMAKIAKHSTTEHAIKVGKEMQAKHVILTHFSRRYPIIPCLKDLESTSNVSVAFDFLQVTLSEAHLLPKLNKDYLVVFEEYERVNLEDNARLANRST